RTHSIRKGKNVRLNLYTKMTNFIEEHLINKSESSTKIKG
ncbi:MAG: dipeptidyl-peptidase-4, partial [Paraglaciecola sp.]